MVDYFILFIVHWLNDGVVVAGANRRGNSITQLNDPRGIFVDDDQTVIIADRWNHRIVQWKKGDTMGQVVAGGNGKGSRLDQLFWPTDVIVDKDTDSLIICDPGNRRVVRWPRRSGTTQGEVLIEKIVCWGVAMDEQRNLYVSDWGKDEVRRYRIGDKNGILVAGGHGQGVSYSQLNEPGYIFVDKHMALYVSDTENHRVMKWNRGAREGIVVAGGHGKGNALTQLSHPQGIHVDNSGTLCIADTGNSRVVRWPQGATEGTVVVGGNSQSVPNQLSHPTGLSLDQQGNLYVADWGHNRIQRFSLE